MPDLESEILINISFRVPAITAMDRVTFTDQLEPVIRCAIIAGGDTVHFSMQPYDPDGDD